MRSRPFAIVVLALAASVGSTLSFAQPRHEERRDEHRDARRDDRRDDRREDRRDDRRDEGREQRGERREDRGPTRAIHSPQQRYYYDARGPEFRRGGHLPPELRGQYYVVRDWRAYRLPPPPLGYQWVQVGPDFVLVVASSGIIANIVIMP